MKVSLYHNIICDNKACYPIRDSPLKRHHLKMSKEIFDRKLSENDITELKRIFYGGITHADCNFCEKAHHP